MLNAYFNHIKVLSIFSDRSKHAQLLIRIFTVLLLRVMLIRVFTVQLQSVTIDRFKCTTVITHRRKILLSANPAYEIRLQIALTNRISYSIRCKQAGQSVAHVAAIQHC